MPTYTFDELIDSAVDCTGFKWTVKKPTNYFEYAKYAKDAANIRKQLSVKKVIFNDPATIVFWEDGTKTVVKCSKNDSFNPYNGFCAALAKKIYGTSRTRKIVDQGDDQKLVEKIFAGKDVK